MHIPKIATPDYWPVALDEIQPLLREWNTNIRSAGKSAGGRDIPGLVLGPSRPQFTFGVIGGTHGHEPGGVAAAMNLIAMVSRGKTLLGEPAVNIVRNIRWVIIPVLNPDARVRCPDGFAGLTFHDINHYASGWRPTGQLEPRVPQVQEIETLGHLGGFYNDAGVDILNATDGSLEGTRSVEVAAVARFFRETKCDLVLDLHAHAFDPMFYTPLGGIADDASLLGHDIAEQVRATAARSGFQFVAPECVASGKMQKVDIPAAALYHNMSGAVPMLFEAPQGCIGAYRAQYGGKECDIRDPGYGYDTIIHCYLFTIIETARVFMARADSTGH